MRRISILLVGICLIQFITGYGALANTVMPAFNVDTNLYIPVNIGKVVDQYSGVNEKNPIIIIQDLHCHYGAQKNISKILNHLKLRYKDRLNLIGVEGNSGYLDTSFLKNFPSKRIKGEIVDMLGEKGLITGPEIFDVSNPLSVQLFGVEDKNIYDENLTQLKEGLFGDDKWKKELDVIRHNVKNDISIKSVIRLDELRDKYNNSGLSLGEYLEQIQNYDEHEIISNYKYIKMFIQADKISKNINKEVVYIETKIIVDELSSMFENEDIKILGECKKEGYEYYLQLKEILDKNRIDIRRRVPNLYQYFKYIELRRSIDNLMLMQELEEYEYKLRAGNADSKEDKDRIFLDRYIKIVKDYCSNGLCSNKFELFESEKNEFFNLLNLYYPNVSTINLKIQINNMSSFYDTAIKRNEIMVRNLLKQISPGLGTRDSGLKKTRDLSPETGDEIATPRIRSALNDNQSVIASSTRGTTKQSSSLNSQFSILNSKNSVAVLVVGGFHADGIQKILRSNGYSYISIIPNIEGKDISRRLYLQRLKVHYNLLSIDFLLSTLALISFINIKEVNNKLYTTVLENLDYPRVEEKELLEILDYINEYEIKEDQHRMRFNQILINILTNRQGKMYRAYSVLEDLDVRKKEFKGVKISSIYLRFKKYMNLEDYFNEMKMNLDKELLFGHYLFVKERVKKIIDECVVSRDNRGDYLHLSCLSEDNTLEELAILKNKELMSIEYNPKKMFSSSNRSPSSSSSPYSSTSSPPYSVYDSPPSQCASPLDGGVTIRSSSFMFENIFSEQYTAIELEQTKLCFLGYAGCVLVYNAGNLCVYSFIEKRELGVIENIDPKIKYIIKDNMITIEFQKKKQQNYREDEVVFDMEDDITCEYGNNPIIEEYESQSFEFKANLSEKVIKSIGKHWICVYDQQQLEYPEIKDTDMVIINQIIKNSNDPQIAYFILSQLVNISMDEEIRNFIKDNVANENMIQLLLNYKLTDFVEFLPYCLLNKDNEDKILILIKNMLDLDLKMLLKEMMSYYEDKNDTQDIVDIMISFVDSRECLIRILGDQFVNTRWKGIMDLGILAQKDTENFFKDSFKALVDIYGRDFVVNNWEIIFELGKKSAENVKYVFEKCLPNLKSLIDQCGLERISRILMTYYEIFSGQYCSNEFQEASCLILKFIEVFKVEEKDFSNLIRNLESLSEEVAGKELHAMVKVIVDIGGFNGHALQEFNDMVLLIKKGMIKDANALVARYSIDTDDIYFSDFIIVFNAVREGAKISEVKIKNKKLEDIRFQDIKFDGVNDLKFYNLLKEKYEIVDSQNFLQFYRASGINKVMLDIMSKQSKKGIDIIKLHRILGLLFEFHYYLKYKSRILFRAIDIDFEEFKDYKMAVNDEKVLSQDMFSSTSRDLSKITDYIKDRNAIFVYRDCEGISLESLPKVVDDFKEVVVGPGEFSVKYLGEKDRYDEEDRKVYTFVKTVHVFELRPKKLKAKKEKDLTNDVKFKYQDPMKNKKIVRVGDVHGNLEQIIMPLIDNRLAAYTRDVIGFDTQELREVDLSLVIEDPDRYIALPKIILNSNPLNTQVIYMGDIIDHCSQEESRRAFYMMAYLLKKQKEMQKLEYSSYKIMSYIMGNHELKTFDPNECQWNLRNDTKLRKEISDAIKKLAQEDLITAWEVQNNILHTHAPLEIIFLEKLKDEIKGKQLTLNYSDSDVKIIESAFEYFINRSKNSEEIFINNNSNMNSQIQLLELDERKDDLVKYEINLKLISEHVNNVFKIYIFSLGENGLPVLFEDLGVDNYSGSEISTFWSSTNNFEKLACAVQQIYGHYGKSGEFCRLDSFYKYGEEVQLRHIVGCDGMAYQEGAGYMEDKGLGDYVGQVRMIKSKKKINGKSSQLEIDLKTILYDCVKAKHISVQTQNVMEKIFNIIGSDNYKKLFERVIIKDIRIKNIVKFYYWLKDNSSEIKEDIPELNQLLQIMQAA